MTVKIYSSLRYSLYQGDGLDYLKTLADNSVDLIVTDPPYFQVKSDAWDNQWASQEEFLGWLDLFIQQYWRVLKSSGSLYLFCSPQLSADTEILIRQRFHVLNHIVWHKPSGPHKRACKEKLRSYFRASERIIFAEHYGAEGHARGQSNLYQKTQALKADVFKPLIDYFKQARLQAGVTAKAINQATETQMCNHWFSSSQWKLPSSTQYAQLQELFDSHRANTLLRSFASLTDEYGQLYRSYQDLLAEHDDIQREYEQLRRPFHVTSQVPYTDVWTFAPVAFYPGKHPCEKPAALIDHILEASGRPGMVVLDSFFGSGAVAKRAVAKGCRFMGSEMDAQWVEPLAKELGLMEKADGENAA